MTTNKPETVWVHPDVFTDRAAMYTVDRIKHGPGPEIQLVRLSDYEVLAAECEKMRREAETERAIQRAAEVLPLGFSIEIEIEKVAGTVALFGPGPSVSCDFHGSLAEQINDAIDSAIQEACHDN